MNPVVAALSDSAAPTPSAPSRIASALTGFFTHDAGQRRRAWLNQKGDDALSGLQYYAGPGLNMGALAQVADAFNPVSDIGRAGTSAQGVVRPGASVSERINAFGGMATDMASVLAPVGAAGYADDAARVLEDAILGASFGAREFGRHAGMVANQPGPLTATGDDTLGAFRLYGGGMSDPTQTGWTFRDVASPNRELTAADNQRISRYIGVREETLPIGQMYATQPTVNADFATTSSSSGELPFVIRKNGKLYLQDGHHRVVRAAEDGAQNARVRFLDLDSADTETPLLDWSPEKGGYTSADDDLFAELFGSGDASGVGRGVAANRVVAPAEARETDGRSRNYVVFDENLISIVQKYGVAGAAAMLGVSAADVQAATGMQE